MQSYLIPKDFIAKIQLSSHYARTFICISKIVMFNTHYGKDEIDCCCPPQYLINNERGCGFHKQGEFSKIVDVDSCGLISDKANQVFQQMKKLCFESGLPVYDQKTHQGFFRHLVIREGVNTGQLMVNLSVCLANLNKEQTN
ncbi:MAG: hypothetical protein LBG59_01780, partial [Candidatus Peribacteria bacterium]|nr:hypothetical protein [Candidatus Peribacteria bacterium]